MFQLIVAIVLALSVATSATAYAADSATPGDLLYGLDRGMEQIQLALTSNPQATAELQIEFAQERMLEAQELASEHDAGNLVIAIENYSAAVQSAADSPSIEIGLQSLAASWGETATRAETLLSEIQNQFSGEDQEGLNQAIEEALANQSQIIQSLQELEGTEAETPEPTEAVESTEGAEVDETSTVETPEPTEAVESTEGAEVGETSTAETPEPTEAVESTEGAEVDETSIAETPEATEAVESTEGAEVHETSTAETPEPTEEIE